MKEIFKQLVNAVHKRDLTTLKTLQPYYNEPLDLTDSFGGDTILHYAAKEGNAEIINYLIANGANPNIENNYGLTPLFSAISLLRVENARALLTMGANIEHYANKDKYFSCGTPLLQLACLNNIKDQGAYYAMLKLLLENGADTKVTNKKGQTAYELLSCWDSRKKFASL